MSPSTQAPTPPPADPAERSALTVLLTLHGRHEFTRRWFAHMAGQLPGAAVLVADGSLDDGAASIVAQAARDFPALRIDYRRFAPDRSVADYQRKLGDAIGSIGTPYVMLADNDDFHVGDGVRQSIALLDREPKLVSARGRTAHLLARGRVKDLQFPIHSSTMAAFDYEFAHPLDQPDTAERMLLHARFYAASWYAVMRTPLAQEWSAALRAHPLVDLALAEWTQAFMCCAAGPQAIGPWPFLFRQYNVTSKTSATVLAKSDQIDRMMAEGWSAEANHAVRTIAAKAAQAAGLSEADAHAAAHRALHEYLEARVIRQGVSRHLRSAGGARWLGGVAFGRVFQRWLAGPAFTLAAKVGVQLGPMRSAHEVLPALRGQGGATAPGDR